MHQDSDTRDIHICNLNFQHFFYYNIYLFIYNFNIFLNFVFPIVYLIYVILYVIVHFYKMSKNIYIENTIENVKELGRSMYVIFFQYSN